MYRIAMIARRPFDVFSLEIFEELKTNQDKDALGVFITCDKKETAVVDEYFKGKNIDYKVYEVAEFFREHWDECTEEKLEYFEKKYECAPIWEYIYTDRILIYRDYDYCVKIATAFFMFWEHIFTEHQIQFYYDEPISTLFTYIAYIVGKKTNTVVFAQLVARGGGMERTNHYFLADPLQLNDCFDENYKNRQYPPEIRKRAEDLLTRFETVNERPEHMKFMSMKEPKFNPKWLVLPLFYVRQRFFNPYVSDPCSYLYYKQYKGVMDPMRFYFRYKKCKKYYKRADYSDKYVYFPLHFQPEASTIVCAPRFEKQLFFIDNLVKSLPAGTKLYVKEHYAGLGSREMDFYEELQKYPNVVIISPFEDSRTLIENAECVATLTGTAGWEAWLLRKPVIMGGDIFYGNAPGIMKVDDIFRQYVPLMENWKQPTREEVIEYLCEHVRTAYAGGVYSLDATRLEKDNVAIVTKSIVDYMEAKLNG